jgi:hypothetical protein
MITRYPYRIEIDTKRKITATSNTEHSVSKPPIKERLAACRFVLQRKYELPLRQEAKRREMWRYTAKLNRFSRNTITKLERKIKKKIYKNSRRSDLE